MLTNLIIYGNLLGLLLMLIVFGPATWRFFREEYKGGFPFDKPVWYYRLRRWWRINRYNLLAALIHRAGLLLFLLSIWVALYLLG